MTDDFPLIDRSKLLVYNGGHYGASGLEMIQSEQKAFVEFAVSKKVIEEQRRTIKILQETIEYLTRNEEHNCPCAKAEEIEGNTGGEL